ncbi:unannotated protein [freshwater metagenome]|uniref:Unannotated protein n=1 Tax=freshwater metagenome TaxID=449393 RepID=A0A6J6LN41_9ZZZZ|nr:hypothetical protein [Actinomycetota bacterium]
MAKSKEVPISGLSTLKSPRLHPFPQLFRSITSALEFLERYANDEKNLATSGNEVLLTVIHQAHLQLSSLNGRPEQSESCECWTLCSDMCSYENHSHSSDEYEKNSGNCKKIIRCYRSNPDSSDHVVLRKKLTHKLTRTFLSQRRSQDLETNERESFLSILSVLVAVLLDSDECSMKATLRTPSSQIRRHRFRRALKLQIHHYLEPTIRKAEFITFPDQLGANHQWRLCHALEAFLRTSPSRRKFPKRRTAVVCEPLVQSAVDKITSWQIQRQDTDDNGAFRSGDNGQPAINVTIAALFAMLQFEQILKLNYPTQRIDEVALQVAVMPVPRKILSIKIPANLQRFGLRGPVETDVAGAWASLLFASFCLIAGIFMFPKPNTAPISATTSTIALASATTTSVMTSASNYVADIRPNTSEFSIVMKSLIAISVISFGSIAFYLISQAFARRRFSLLGGETDSNRFRQSIVNLQQMRESFILSIAKSIQEQIESQKFIPPDLAARTISELVRSGYFSTSENLSNSGAKMRQATLNGLVNSLSVRDMDDPILGVRYTNNVDRSLVLAALVDLFSLSFSGEELGAPKLFGVTRTEIIDSAHHQISVLVKSQESGNERAGGWRINDKDSRASVFATAQVVRTLTRIVDSKNATDLRFQKALTTYSSELEPHNKREEISIASIKDAVASGVTYLRSDLLEKIDRESKPWSIATGTRTEIYRVALPLIALSERAIFRGKHGADEVEIRAAIEWIQNSVLDPACPDREDQVLQRETDVQSKYKSFVHRHSVSRHVVEGILSGEISLEKSFLQSQLGPMGTSGRPITSRLFQSAVQRCILAVQHLSLRPAKGDITLLSDQVDALAIANRCNEYIDKHLTAGQIWIEYCRSAEFLSARPLPLLHVLPRQSRNRQSLLRPVVAAVQLNRPARRFLLGSVILGVILTAVSGFILDPQNYSLQEWRALMAIASLPLVVPLAAVFQFITKPKTISSSLRWSIGVVASQFFSITGLFK